MTAKRFTVDDGLENVLCWEINDKENEDMTCGECAKLLNELHETNEQLKEDNKILNRINDRVNGWNGLAHDMIFKLEKENEQLKKENNKLHQKIFEMRTNVALDRTEISRQSYTPKEFLDKIEKW